jgi:sulfite reductase beta subunit-like hemoprotein
VSKKNRLFKVALKYCGSCNPRVDLRRIASYLTRRAEERGDFQLVPPSDESIDVVVILCGCPRACGNKEGVKARAKRSLVTAGESVNRQPVPESELPQLAERELDKILKE